MTLATQVEDTAELRARIIAACPGNLQELSTAVGVIYRDANNRPLTPIITAMVQAGELARDRDAAGRRIFRAGKGDRKAKRRWDINHVDVERLVDENPDGVRFFAAVVVSIPGWPASDPGREMVYRTSGREAAGVWFVRRCRELMPEYKWSLRVMSKAQIRELIWKPVDVDAAGLLDPGEPPSEA